MYSNDSYIMERGYEDLYERSETISQPKDCGCCQGDRVIQFSSCCGADFKEHDVLMDHVCTDCGEICEVVTEKCDICGGEGLIYE